jgi:D-sedoheptulose 7-phosphate isomerase
MTAPSGGPGGPPAPGTVESLYPFLYSGGPAGSQGPASTPLLDSVLEQIRASTVAKTGEILELRRVVRDRDGDRLVACARQMAGQFMAGGRLLAFGNGGSATDAQQLVTMFLNPASTTVPASTADSGEPRALPAIGLASDPSVLTALSNDVGVDVIFARQLAAFGRVTDIAVGLSTSGNSENLLRAFDEASRRGMLTIGIAGYDGGRMAEIATLDYLFVAPSSSVHRIQEAQTTIYDILWELCQAELRRPELSR